MLVGYGGAFDRQRARFGCFDRAIASKPNSPGGFVVGHHGDDGIGAIGGIRRRIRPARAARDQIVRLGLAAIPDRDREAAIEIAAGHAAAHPSETDEGNMGHYSTSSIEAGGAPKARCASVAAMNSSRSPSSTPEVSDVCTPVRRSFTI